VIFPGDHLDRNQAGRLMRELLTEVMHANGNGQKVDVPGIRVYSRQLAVFHLSRYAPPAF
jgi:hypothetical protein